MKNMNNFQMAKVKPQVLLSICFNFYQFQPSVAYKSAAYKTKRVRSADNSHATTIMVTYFL